MKRLKEYEKDDISPDIIQRLQPFTKKPEFEPEKIKKASKAAEGMCLWARAIYVYDDVLKVVRPK